MGAIYFTDRTSKRDYAMGTCTYLSPMPFASLASGRALCSDGAVRAFYTTGEPDTFFSVPAAIRVGKRTVSGFVSFTTVDGFTCESEEDPTVVIFTATGRNRDALPEWGNLSGALPGRNPGEWQPTIIREWYDTDPRFVIPRVTAILDANRRENYGSIDRHGWDLYDRTVDTLANCDVPSRALALAYLTMAGNSRVPCSRYGTDSEECAEVAYRHAYVIAREMGEPMTFRSLDYSMSMAVNDSEGIADTIRNYGHREYR